MILDALSAASRYVPLHPGFGRGFEFLTSAALERLPAGKHEIDGQRLFVLISHDPGRGRQAARLESHRNYIDIQYVVRGVDEMGWKPLAACGRVETPYDPNRDVGFFADQPETWINVAAGQFVIFWPEDAHAPLSGQGDLIKAVVKVALV
jgi:YhcH/YjgK/YiaL family protein